jgi:hypothetical protein
MSWTVGDVLLAAGLEPEIGQLLGIGSMSLWVLCVEGRVLWGNDRIGDTGSRVGMKELQNQGR